MLGIGSCTAALEIEATYTKLSDKLNVHFTTVVCNLIVHQGFLPVIFMGPKNFKYLSSTEHLPVFKEGGGICQFCKTSAANFISQQM